MHVLHQVEPVAMAWSRCTRHGCMGHDGRADLVQHQVAPRRTCALGLETRQLVHCVWGLRVLMCFVLERRGVSVRKHDIVWGWLLINVIEQCFT